MPLLDYDYDYLASLDEEERYNREERRRRQQREREKNYKKTSNKTKEQVRRFMLETSEPTTRRTRTSKVSEPVMGEVAPYVKRVYDFESSDNIYRTINVATPAKVSYRKNVEEIEEVEEVETEEIEEVEEVNEKKHVGNKKSSYFTNFMLALLIAVGALFICYRASIKNEKFNSIERAKKQLLNAQTVNEQLQADIDSETDISYIENYARYQLGMQKPQDSQIMYINVEKQDKIYTQTKLDDEEKAQSWFDVVVEKIANNF